MPTETPRSNERPRERCLAHGPRALSLRECLALLIGSGPPGMGALGLASALLEKPGRGLSSPELERAYFSSMEVSGQAHLKGIKGIGPAHQARILAAFELGRRYAVFRESLRQRPNRLPQNGARSAALLRVTPELRTEPQEWLAFVPCYHTGQIGELCLVERGVRTHVNFDPVELFARVLCLRPRGFVLFHNHPSGDLTPSLEDHELTSKVRATAKTFGIELLDHGIVTASGESWLVGSPLC